MPSMNRWRSYEGAAAILLWGVILLSGAFGCGITREVSLPNGYICYVDKFIWIAQPDQLETTVDDVGQLDVQGDIVFGRRYDSWKEEFIGYFILDTQRQSVWYTQDDAAWREQLAKLGIEKLNLRWPGVFFNGVPFIWKIMPWVIGTVLIAVVSGGVHLIARHERQVRQDRLDRL